MRCEAGRGDTPSQHISLSASYLNPDPPARRLPPCPSAPYYSRRGFIFTCGLPPVSTGAVKKQTVRFRRQICLVPASLFCVGDVPQILRVNRRRKPTSRRKCVTEKTQEEEKGRQERKGRRKKKREKRGRKRVVRLMSGALLEEREQRGV